MRSLRDKIAALQQSVQKSKPIPSSDEAESTANVPRVSSEGAANGDSLQGHEDGRPLEPESLDGTLSPQTEPSFAGSRAEALEEMGFQQRTNEHGTCWVRTLRYDCLISHGYSRFVDFLTVDSAGLLRVAKIDPSALDSVSYDEGNGLAWRFYDTETTGLGTGAGTFPFLHAVGQFEDDDFVVYQYFLADYSEEAALLTELRRHFEAPGTIVVSFNGKSFDWPLLKNRLVMYRFPVIDARQMDLLFPARRFWKANLGKVSLSAVESGVLGLFRTDDLPGREAPNRYFQFTYFPEVSTIQPVLDHNAMDICSLVTLAIVVSDILTGRRSVETSSELVALARWYDEWQEHDLADSCYSAASECPDATWRTFWLKGAYCKRKRNWDEAVAIWKSMSDRYAWSVQPLVELAKHAEHYAHDYRLAEEWTREAIRRCQGHFGDGLHYDHGRPPETTLTVQHTAIRLTPDLHSRQHPADSPQNSTVSRLSDTLGVSDPSGVSDALGVSAVLRQPRPQDLQDSVHTLARHANTLPLLEHRLRRILRKQASH